MTRLVDRGAIVAACVGIGMAAVIAVSFLLVIPIEPIYWFLALPAGLLIGYYAGSRSNRLLGPWPRIVVDGAFAGLVTGLSLAALLLAVKALFFFADTGYRDASLGGPIACAGGAECVYQRYLSDGRGPDFARAGVTDVDSFTAFYWEQQLGNSGLVLGLCLGGSLLGAGLYGIARPGRRRPAGSEAAPLA